MKDKSIKNKVALIRQVESHIVSAQKLWQKKTKKFILNVLEAIVQDTDFKWYTGVNDEKINNETIYLVMEDQPSGIHYNSKSALNQEEGLSGPLIKYCGYINFSLLHNGSVITWLSYPHIEDLIPPAELKVLNMYLQEDISEDVIHENVALFLDDLHQWYNISKQAAHTIGFKFGQNSKSNGTPVSKN